MTHSPILTRIARKADIIRLDAKQRNQTDIVQHAGEILYLVELLQHTENDKLRTAVNPDQLEFTFNGKGVPHE